MTRESIIVFRGAPKGIVDASELDGLGGGINEMLGSGLYTTTDYELAAYYAQSVDDCVYKVRIDVESDLILNVDSDTQIPLLDDDYGNAAQDYMVNYRIPPFYVQLKDSVYVFGIDDLDDLDQLYYRPTPRQVQLSTEFLQTYSNDIKYLYKLLVPLSKSLKDPEFLSKLRSQSFMGSFEDDVFDNYLDYESFDRDLTDAEIAFLKALCAEIYKTYHTALGSGLELFATERGVPKSNIYLADLNELAGIASSAGFAVLSVSDLLEYNETVVLDTNKVTLSLIQENPHAPRMFHASSKSLKTLKPQTHPLSPKKPIVFGTPSLDIALAFLQPWDDSMLELGVVGDDPPYLIEMYPGAFNDIFAKKMGYVYELDPSTFYQTPAIAHFEAISEKSPTILKTYKVLDALKALKQSELQLVFYKDAKRFRESDYRRI